VLARHIGKDRKPQGGRSLSKEMLRFVVL
jgi:hypothetical protein